MPDYSKGKIYSIRSRSRLDLVYIGSTIQPLHKRFYSQKIKFKNNKLKCTSKYVFEIGDAYIELIENYPCECKSELEKKEGETIRSIECVNKNIAGRTIKQYRRDNEAKIKEHRDKYRITHKEYFKIKSAEYHEKNKEAIHQRHREYARNNKEAINMRHRIYYNRNKEAIKAKLKPLTEEQKQKNRIRAKINYNKNKERIIRDGKIKVQCPQCNVQMAKSSLGRHMRTIHK